MTEVDIEVTALRGSVRIEVRDDGPGIAAMSTSRTSSNRAIAGSRRTDTRVPDWGWPWRTG